MAIEQARPIIIICSHVCLFVCSLAYLLNCQLVCLLDCLLDYLPTCLLTCMHCLPTLRFTDLPTGLRTYRIGGHPSELRSTCWLTDWQDNGWTD